jgi:uroporphyrinogen III methyltransferase/synthase
VGALDGKTVIVTRAAHQAGEFIRLLEERGANAVAIPTIEIVDPESWETADRALESIGSYDWLILTSVNGVRFFLRRVQQKLGGLSSLAGMRICAVGPRTREALLREGLRVDFMPAEHIAEAIVEESGEDWKGKRVLFARAEEGRDVIPDGLRALGAEVDLVSVYRNVLPGTSADEFRSALSGGKADAITFTSASTVKNFIELLPRGEAERLLQGTVVACIGPVTSAAAESGGLAVEVEPQEYTTAALAEALEKHFSQRAEAG